MHEPELPVLVRFSVPGKGIGKGRARSTASGHHYTPKKTENAEAVVKLYCDQAMKRSKVETIPAMQAVGIIIHIWMHVPQTIKGYKLKKAERTDLLQYSYPVGKPDSDNVQKLVMDAMNGVAWMDDSQVSQVHVHRHYTADDHGEWIRVEFGPLPRRKEAQHDSAQT